MNKTLWDLVEEEYDEKLERMTAIILKESLYTRYYTFPAPAGSIGYWFDFTEKTGYDHLPEIRIEFAKYFQDSGFETYGQNSIVFGECIYKPSYIEREFKIISLPYEGKERMVSAKEGSLTWEVDLVAQALLKSKMIAYSVVYMEKESIVELKDNVLSISFDEYKYNIALNDEISYGVYANDCTMKDDLAENKLTKQKKGRYIIIKHVLESNHKFENLKIVFGLSSESAVKAKSALDTSMLEKNVSDPWNKWFDSLPKLKFIDDREKKAYYKCWWIIRLNYYNHPEWGFNILESLPSYKGIWQWAVGSVGWHNNQDTHMTSQWIKKALSMMFDYQRADGYVTHAIYINEKIPGLGWSGGENGRGTIQAPHVSWASLEYYNATQDKDTLEKWYPSLEKYYDYICKTRDLELENLHLWAIFSSYDTGIDTAPAFHKVTYGENENSENYCYPSIFAGERWRFETTMASICKILGEDETKWLAESKKTKEAMETYLWDEKKKWYGVRHEDGTLDTRIAIDGLYPLINNMVDTERAKGMEEAFIRLIGPNGIRTQAIGEEGYSENYWRGPTWPKACSLAAATCINYYPHLIQKVQESTINFCLARPNIWECFISEKAIPARGDQGGMCTTNMSSNVGAGDILGCLFMARGFEMYNPEGAIPLAEYSNYHYMGLRISCSKEKGEWNLSACREEKEKAEVNFKLGDGITEKIMLNCGNEQEKDT